MKVIASTGREDVAMVYIVDLGNENLVECVESVQPPLPREKKWVLLVSTMFGCPVGCMMCDAGGYFHARLTSEEILAQIDFLVEKRFPGGRIPCSQFKIQFARMGEPALNSCVLDVLESLPLRYEAPGLMPSLSTIAPRGAERFFERLLMIKERYYSGGRFQFQFSIHTTDQSLRDRMIPVKKWSFDEMAAYGERFYAPGDRKVTLNFALVQGAPVDPEVLLYHFPIDKFLIKITPLNPTYRATENSLSSYIDPYRAAGDGNVAESLRQAGYEVIVSIGDLEESQIGSNCGQYVRRHLEAKKALADGYTYQLDEYPAF
jgi:23S rRNA (adenine2503-C2)-methyltransferase